MQPQKPAGAAVVSGPMPSPSTAQLWRRASSIRRGPSRSASLSCGFLSNFVRGSPVTRSSPKSLPRWNAKSLATMRPSALSSSPSANSWPRRPTKSLRNPNLQQMRLFLFSGGIVFFCCTPLTGNSLTVRYCDQEILLWEGEDAMILCFRCTAETKADLDRLLANGAYQNYDEAIAAAIRNQALMEQEVAENGAIVI